MPDYQITCPGCNQPLHVPAEAVGMPAHCPHCKARFHLPAAADGSPGTPQPLRPRWGLPRPLVVPAFGLLLLGLSGTLVNGYLSVLFEFKPGAAMEFARGRVREVRSAEVYSSLGKKSGGWSHAPEAAIVGVAAAGYEEEQIDERLAASWAPAMQPVHLIFTGISAVAALGGLAILLGRWYPLALLGCVAAIINVNHLCCLPGAVAGVWGILMLVRDEVREYFRRPPTR
jgi:hypothetical protein